VFLAKEIFARVFNFIIFKWKTAKNLPENSGKVGAIKANFSYFGIHNLFHGLRTQNEYTRNNFHPGH